MSKRLTLGLLLLGGISFSILLAGCQSTDIVATGAKQSFNLLVDNTRVTVTPTSTAALGLSDLKDQAYWQIQSPKDPNFLLAIDPSQSVYDAALSFEATDFIQAGLDVKKLPKDFLYLAEQNRIYIFSNFGEEPLSPSKSDLNDIQATFATFTKTYRSHIGYHEALDHFGIDLGLGNMFEWSKSPQTNDKDMVFVLNPEPFIAAGVDVTLLKTWIFAKVTVMDKNNNKIEVDKLLMPFELND